MRHLWARVLAGEIRRTGSFSLSTLRLLSEMDQQMATTFENEVRYRIANAQILTPKPEEFRGARLKSLTFLEDVGLLKTIDPNLGLVRTISPDSNGRAHLREQDLVLLMEMRGNVKMPITPLTRIGQEIVGILPPADPLAVLEKVGSAIEDEVDAMEIRRIVATKEKGFTTAPSRR